MRSLGSMLPKLGERSGVLQKASVPLQGIAVKLGNSRERLRLLVKICVFLPTAIMFFYMLLFHSNMYLSESIFAVRTGGVQSMSDVGMSAMLGLPGGDSQIVLAYITSAHMLERVSEEIDLHGHYADPGRDVWSRLWQNPTREELISYWQWVVKAAYDMEKGVISVEVKAYDPMTAKAINAVILKQSELFVNSMNVRANEDAVQLASREVGRAEKRMADAAASLREFRDTKSTLDPVVTAKGLEGVISTLEAEAANSGAELLAAQKLMRTDSLGVANIKNRLDSLHTQIEHEKARLAGIGVDKGALSAMVAEYSSLLLEEEFAGKQLVSAMSMYETARVQATAQARYIVPVQPPTLPEESGYPRVFLYTLLGFVAFLTIFGLISLSVASIRDHMGV